MSHAQVLAPRHDWTLADKVREVFGRPRGRLPGSYLDDVATQRQCIILCPQCEGKYRPRRRGYRVWREYLVGGKCDACRAQGPRNVAWMAEEHHACVIGARPVRRGRWAL